MIKIIDDWYVTVDTNPINYAVRRGSGNFKKKQGYTDKPLAFAGSLAGAIKNIRKQIIAERFSDGSRTLADALQTISKIDSRFEQILKEVTA